MGVLEYAQHKEIPEEVFEGALELEEGLNKVHTEVDLRERKKKNAGVSAGQASAPARNLPRPLTTTGDEELFKAVASHVAPFSSSSSPFCATPPFVSISTNRVCPSSFSFGDRWRLGRALDTRALNPTASR